MDCSSDRDECEAELQAYKKAVAISAIRHLSSIDARTLTLFHNNGIFESQTIPDNSELTLAVLGDADHPLRVKAPAGPLLFHKVDRDKPGRSVVYVADLFFSPDRNVRKASYEFMTTLDQSEFSTMTPRTAVVLQAQAEKLLSAHASEWRMAAVTVSDLIKDDWLCNLAATRQCLAMDFLEGTGRFFTAVMRPTVSSVESIMKSVWAATEQKEQIVRTITGCVEQTESPRDALSLYYDRLGHLPLTSTLSVNRLIDEWQRKKGGINHLWKLLWDWADSVDSPLPRYHVCCVAINRLELLGDAEAEHLWREIADIISLSNDAKTESKWSQAWLIRCELARHFTRHLESRLPGSDSERIVSQAFWLAEQTALLFGTEAEGLRRIRKDTLDPEYSISEEVWHFARPPLKPSRLRYAASSNQSVWSLSLLCQIGPKLDKLHSERTTADAAPRIALAALRSLPILLPPIGEGQEVYAFDNTLLPTAKKLFAHRWDEEPSNRFKVLLNTLETTREQGELNSLLKRLPFAENDVQLLAACAVRCIANTDQLSDESLWALVSDQEWRDALLLRGDSQIVEMVCNGLSEVQVRGNREQWSQLPHMIASACERSVDEKDRMRLLFALTMRSAIISDSVSAIERLLRGEHYSKLKDEVSFWRDRLEAVRPYCPDWVKGRIRATLACLNSV